MARDAPSQADVIHSIHVWTFAMCSCCDCAARERHATVPSPCVRRNPESLKADLTAFEQMPVIFRYIFILQGISLWTLAFAFGLGVAL